MHRQAVFQEVLDRTINRRLVTQTLFVKFKGDTLTQLVNAFPDTSQVASATAQRPGWSAR